MEPKSKTRVHTSKIRGQKRTWKRNWRLTTMQLLSDKARSITVGHV